MTRRSEAVSRIVAHIRKRSLAEASPDSGIVPYLFDPNWYRGQCNMSFEDAEEAWSHYLAVGVGKGLDPHPLFSADHYRAQTGLPENTDPLEHFIVGGATQGISPHPHFDSGWYLKRYEDVSQAGVNPLEHYLRHGAGEGRNPNPGFFSSWYLDENPDVAAAGMNPLVHWVVFGEQEGRRTSPLDCDEMSLLTDRRSTTLVTGTAPIPPPSLEPRSLGLDLPEELADYSVVSLDCWDTLLFRRCHPEATKLAAARYLLYRAYDWIRPELRAVVDLYEQRLSAERHVSAMPDGEYRFADAARVWIDRIVTSATDAHARAEVHADLLRFEIEFEKSVTTANPAMRSVLERVATKKLYVCSDFYLSANDMKEIIRGNDIESRFDGILVSSDLGLSKRSGRLFDHLLDQAGADASDVLHIGDNPAADIEAANDRGLTGVLHEVDRPSILDEATTGHLASNPDAHLDLLETLTWEAHNAHDRTADDEMFSLGVRLAPIFTGFSLRIAEEAVKQGAKRVYFSTREGRILQSLYETARSMSPYGVDFPPSSLLHLSRVATFGPSLHELSRDELMRLWNMYSGQSPRAFLASLGAETDELLAQFEAAGLPADVVVEHPWENDAFTGLLDSPPFREEVARLISEARQRLLAYLEQEGFDGRNSLFVEVGWRGTIQDNLSHVLGKPLSGVYLGLFGYLNEQPGGSRKIGWLFDDNHDREGPTILPDVGPVEMLLGAVGGSVTGYAVGEEDGRITPTTSVVVNEDAVLAGPVAAFQDGLLYGARRLVGAAHDHALTSAGFRSLARLITSELLHRPPSTLARTFFSYSHNEVFGTGEVQQLDEPTIDSIDVADTAPERCYRLIHDVMTASRWPDGAAVVLSDQLGHNRPLLQHVPTRVFARTPGLDTDRSIGIFAPPPMTGSGGHLTIYHLARALSAVGLKVSVLFEDLGSGTSDAVDFFAGSGVRIESNWSAADDFYDYVVATVDYSAPLILELNAGARGYLVQDFEALFNPVGHRFAAAEISYIGGFDFLCVGNWLGHVLGDRFGQPAYCSGLGADHNVYHELDTAERERAVCFLYQPEKPRRATELGLDALRFAQAKDPSIKVYFYGSDTPPPADIAGESLGLIRSHAELNALYNRCSVGLCISMTNPSRIPYEMMAAGMVPIDVYRYNNLFDYADGTALLCLQGAQSLGSAITALLDSDRQLAEHRRRCRDFIDQRLRKWETDAMVNVILARVNGLACRPSTSTMTYSLDGYIAAENLLPGAADFCDHQRAMASRRRV